MKSSEDLRTKLRSIDHRSYPAYKDLKGEYDFRDYILSIDHVQGDPFAAPSRLSIRVPAGKNGFPAEYYENRDPAHHPAGSPDTPFRRPRLQRKHAGKRLRKERSSQRLTLRTGSP